MFSDLSIFEDLLKVGFILEELSVDMPGLTVPCLIFFQLINSISSLSYPLFSPPSVPSSVAWVFFRSQWMFHIRSSSLLTLLHQRSFCFLPLFYPTFLSVWGNTTDISPTWLPDTASTPFLASPFLTPMVSLFSLLLPPALPSLTGAKAKQKLSPDLAEVIGIKLQWKWKCQ